MTAEVTDELAPLLPDRHLQHDLFICDVADAVLKDVGEPDEHRHLHVGPDRRRAVRHGPGPAVVRRDPGVRRRHLPAGRRRLELPPVRPLTDTPR